MARTRKPTHDLLMPASGGWSRWSGVEGGPCQLMAEHPASGGDFGREAQERVLGLPAACLWVLPAWLNGDAAHLEDMAALHLERLGVRVADTENGLRVQCVVTREGAHLACIVALKDLPVPLADLSRLPDHILPAAACYDLPADSIVILRELGRLVVAITRGKGLIYYSPLSAHRLDEQALGELNNLCLQLGFQRALGNIESIVLWLPDFEGDLDQVVAVTGLAARREIIPEPCLPESLPAAATLVPADILAARARLQTRARARVAIFSASLALAACAAVIAVLTTFAMQERSRLRDQVAALSPQASLVLDQKKSWMEAAPAVDPGTFPMQVLLDCMTPASSTEVSMTNFEWAPDRLLLRGRTPTPELALQYAGEIKEVEALARYQWETPAPAIASDNTATFEYKGGTAP